MFVPGRQEGPAQFKRAGPSAFSSAKEINGFSLAEYCRWCLQLPGKRRCPWQSRHLGGACDGCVNWRSAAGEWLLWFALRGGPPDFWKVPCPSVAIGRGLAGRGYRPARVFLRGRVVLGRFEAVEDDLLNLAGGVSSPD